MWTKIIAIFMMSLFCMSGISFAGVFDSNSTGPRILLAEVKGYGEDELRPEFLAHFREVLGDQMQMSKKFQVDLSRLSDGTYMDLDQQKPEDKLFSIIHMDAIAHSHLYRRELANAQMIRYGDSIMGKAYYQDDEKTAQRMKAEGQPYNLTSNVEYMLKELGQKYNVDYMLFVNMRDADVFRKTGGIFGTGTTEEDIINKMRGKKVTFEMEYYLINVKTGKVFEAQNSNKKSAVMKNIVVGKEGIKTNAAQLLTDILKQQAAQIVKNLEGKSLKAIGGE